MATDAQLEFISLSLCPRADPFNVPNPRLLPPTLSASLTWGSPFLLIGALSLKTEKATVAEPTVV